MLYKQFAKNRKLFTQQKRMIVLFLDCVNEYGDDLCDFYAQVPDYCKYNAAFMEVSCAKSCGVCESKYCVNVLK